MWEDTLSGTQIKAVYRETLEDEGRWHPYLEALPTTDEVIAKFKAMSYKPIVNENERNASMYARASLVRKLENYSCVFPDYVMAAVEVDSLIRQGYYTRNPLIKEYKKELIKLAESRTNLTQKFDVKNIIDIDKSTASMLHLWGYPGTGKSTLMTMILNSYPQVIWHEDYNGIPMDNKAQIVWLKLEVPATGTMPSLCTQIFRSIDSVLDQDEKDKYYLRYGNRNVNSMLDNIRILASIHGIGVIVLDEMQRLIKKDSDKEIIIRYLTQMANTTKVPFILLGTPDAEKLNKEFYMIRRFGPLIGDWDRLQKNGEKWNSIVNDLWGMQLLKNPGELTDEINDRLYEESQGIISILITLFRMSQFHAIMFGEERLSSELIEMTMLQNFPDIRKALEGFRKNDMSLLKDYPDLVKNLGKVENEYYKGEARKIKNDEIIDAIETDQKIRHELIDKICSDIITSNIARNLTPTAIEKIIENVVLMNIDEKDIGKLTSDSFLAVINASNEKKEKKNKRKPAAIEKTGLNKAIYDSDGKSNYEALKESGYIPSEEKE